jgi:CubicO group peptidase (beta-lactamase class C family)
MVDRSSNSPVKRRTAVRAALTRSLLTVVALPLYAATLFAQSSVDLGALDTYFAAAGDAWRVPGYAVAIVKDDQVVFAKGYGERNINEGGAVDEHTLFAIASNSKAFTTASLARLVDDSLIGWDDRVVGHLPYFQLYDPYVTQEMRIRDLLSHRSGLGTYSGDLIWYGTKYSSEQVIRRARYLEPAGSFRADYGYQNIMFVAAGEIIPAATGRSWDEFVRTEFLEPLGMSRTVTSVSRLEGVTNVATPHSERDGVVMSFPWYPWDAMAAAGGIISSVSDMARWIRLQLAGGTLDGRTYFSESAQRSMWTPHISYVVNEESEKRYPTTHFRGYGLGWGLMDYQGRKVMTHGGGYDGMFSRVALVPEEKLGLVILTNSTTRLPVALTYRILDAYLGGDERDWNDELLQLSHRDAERWRDSWAKRAAERVPDTKPSLALEKYTGTYGGPMYGDATVSRENGKLVVRLLPNPDLIGDLRHWHFDTFEVDWRHEFPWFDKGTVQFVMDAMGNVGEMKIDVPNEDFWFTELEFKKKE